MLDRYFLGKYNTCVFKIKSMEEQTKPQTTINDVFEIVSFIKDNAVAKEEFGELKRDVTELKKDVTAVKSNMATKDFVTEKLSDLQGNLVVLMRKEDTKLKALVETLTDKQVITEEDKKRILSLEPFPSLM